MRWSGLAIKDAVTLERNGLDRRGTLFLRRAKTGVPVFVPLPPTVVSSLRNLPSANPSYFFWSGIGNPRSADQVSALLGHRSVKMTEKHYLPWVKARQKQLTVSVRRAWFPEVRQPLPETAGTKSAKGLTGLRLPFKNCCSVETHGCSNVRMAPPLLLYL